MAQGNVPVISGSIAAHVGKIKDAYMDIRRLMDRLIIIRNNTDYEAVAVALGIPEGPNQTAQGQMAFDNLDAALGAMTTANNALSNMDQNAL